MLQANISEAFSSLYAAKQRTLLALLGIVIGVGSVIAMVSVGLLTQQENLRRYMSMGVDLIGIEKSREADENTPRISLEAARLLAKKSKYLDHASPVVRNWDYMVFEGQQGYTGLLGVDESFPQIHRLKLQAGRFLTKLDRHHNFAVIGPSSISLFDGEVEITPELIGKKIRIGDELVTIIGIFEEADSITRQVANYWLNYSMLVPIRLAQKLAEIDGIDLMVARIKEGADFNHTRQEITRHFARYARNVPIDIKNSYELIKDQQKQALLFTAMLGAIGSISLLVGGIGVMNVMLVSVSERRREIGIRRALGATRGDIQSQFLIEAVILSLLGGFLGALLGVGSSYLYANYEEMEFMISYGAVALGVGFSSVVGIFFGFYPAWKAARLDPIAALRAE